MIYFTGDFETDCLILYQYIDELPLFTTRNREKYSKDGKAILSNVYGTTQFGYTTNMYKKKAWREKAPEGGYYTKLRTLYPEYDLIFKEFVGEYVDNFDFNQVVINKNFEIQKHVDAQNVGVSYIIGLGDYTGGKLCIERNNEVEKHNIHHKFYTFNGSKHPHYVEPFKGTRYTLVFYNIKK